MTGTTKSSGCHTPQIRKSDEKGIERSNLPCVEGFPQKSVQRHLIQKRGFSRVRIVKREHLCEATA